MLQATDVSDMFRFALHQVDEIEPWGAPSAPSLSWYGLSLGAYSIGHNGHDVLRYSPSAVNYCLSNFPQARYRGDQVEYQVARLHEDLLDALPSILTAAPDRIARVFRVAGATEIFRRARVLLNDVEEDHHVRALVDALNARRLDTAYLSPAPLLLFWRDGDLIHFEWNGRGQTLADGVPAWKHPEGHVSLSADQFVSEVQSFHAAFVTQMASRIHRARENWSRPTVAIDYEELERSQRLHEEMLGEVLTKSPAFVDVDWSTVECGLQLCSQQ